MVQGQCLVPNKHGRICCFNFTRCVLEDDTSALLESLKYKVRCSAFVGCDVTYISSGLHIKGPACTQHVFGGSVLRWTSFGGVVQRFPTA